MFDSTNLPTAPGALLGYWRDGRPFYLIAGGAPGDDEGDDSGNDQGGNDDDGADGTGDDDSGSGSRKGRDRGRGGSGSRDRDRDGSSGDDDGDSQGGNAITAVRNEFKAERERRQAAEKRVTDLEAAQAKLQKAIDEGNTGQQKFRDDMAKALGLKDDDKPPTVEELAKKLTDATRQAEDAVKAREDAEAKAGSALAQAQRERAVVMTAPGLDANVVALLDSRSFMDEIGRLDPAADDFRDQLTESIKGALDRNPSYKATRPRKGPDHKSSGGDFGDSKPQDARQWTDEDVDRASADEVIEAQNKGLLRDLGVGQPRRRRGEREGRRH